MSPKSPYARREFTNPPRGFRAPSLARDESRSVLVSLVDKVMLTASFLGRGSRPPCGRGARRRLKSQFACLELVVTIIGIARHVS